MKMTVTLRAFGARYARSRFGEVLAEALNRPVGITRRGHLTAYVVSKGDFEALVNHIHDLEDQLWLAKAQIAHHDGYAECEEVRVFLNGR
ncbi:type II toxin-antitoxin system Phd/YefM family antitoxin [Cupriavidus gilardii]|uniref:type II toxin-antitoxin system Phd/YefM family antitoxin n=1 Tax=Cupriavidus gilardii TaxID=82541 RepID=UPI001ABDEEC8|nr:type II toxin-antitoxin system Phd/YefM family antitoxin [Cupriavidus gilardii]MBO4122836.1 type II toxin-antitoxin system Phd/YefM family antitoxin [Cupriavidus gilardii]